MPLETLAHHITRQGRLTWSSATVILRKIIVALEEQSALGANNAALVSSSIQLDGGDVASVQLVAANRDAVDSVRYLAPEIVRGQNSTAKTMTWSLAVLLYQMISGVTPFAADDLALLKYQILYESPALLPAGSSAPGGLSPILARALSKDPDLRPDPAEFVASVLQLKPDPVVAPNRRRAGVGWPLWASAIMVVGVLTVAGILLVPRLLSGHGRIVDSSTGVVPTATPAPTPTDAIEHTPTADPLLEADFIAPDTSDGVGLVDEASEGTSPAAQTPVQEREAEATPTLVFITSTPTPTSIPTETPTPILRATLIPTATRPRSTATPQRTVRLLEPADGAEGGGTITFAWEPGFTLEANQSWEMAFWKAGSDALSTGFSPSGARLETTVSVNLDAMAAILPQLRAGEYQWGVFLVEVEPFRRVSLLGETRRFVYTGSPSSGGGDGDGGGIDE